MPNRFSVQPANIMTGMNALREGINTRVDMERKKAAQISRQGLRERAGNLFENGTPEEIRKFATENPEIVKEMAGSTKDRADIQRQNYVSTAKRVLFEGVDPATALIENADRVAGDGIDASETMQAAQESMSDPATGIRKMEVALALYGSKSDWDQYQKTKGEGESELTTAQRDFKSLTKELRPADVLLAKRISLGLDPRAVGSAVQTITKEGTAEEIADTEAVIAERKKFAAMTGSSRARAIDKGFEKIQKLTKNIGNLDNAMDAVMAGAGTGAISRRFPSIKGTSVLLDQIQGELALDVIGGVTLGAISAGELDLAKAVAIPTGLEGPELIKWLQDKKASQTKLLGYFQDQIDFLDQGGSVAGFLRSKERKISLPEGVTEDDITTTMELRGMTREQVLTKLGAK